jgi:hypothetical protein
MLVVNPDDEQAALLRLPVVSVVARQKFSFSLTGVKS